jgi:hypothetical protein
MQQKLETSRFDLSSTSDFYLHSLAYYKQRTTLLTLQSQVSASRWPKIQSVPIPTVDCRLVNAPLPLPPQQERVILASVSQEEKCEKGGKEK